MCWEIDGAGWFVLKNTSSSGVEGWGLLAGTLEWASRCLVGRLSGGYGAEGGEEW